MNFKVVLQVVALLILASIPLEADQPPFSTDQVKKLHNLLIKGNGTFKATGNRLGYEFSILPNNTGYLMRYNAPGGGESIRLDVNFKLVSATTTNSTSAPPSVLAPSEAKRIYNEDIVTWREILDHT